MEKTSENVQNKPKPLGSNVEAAIAYILGLVTGLVIFLIAKDKFAKFHGLQSIFLALAFAILRLIFDFIPIANFPAKSILGLFYIILTIVLIVKAYRGERYKLPIVGDFAEKYSRININQ